MVNSANCSSVNWHERSICGIERAASAMIAAWRAAIWLHWHTDPRCDAWPALGGGQRMRLFIAVYGSIVDDDGLVDDEQEPSIA